MLLTTACGDGPSASAGPRHLLLITVDTLRADRLGCYGNDEWGRSPSPRIDELAREGTLFSKAWVSRGETHPSLASLLTGKYPITTGVRENGFPLTRAHATLMQHLHARGFRTGAFVANFEIAWKNDSWVARGTDVAADGFGGQRRAETADGKDFQAVWDTRVEQAALEFLAGCDPRQPFALWVHFYDVHKPYHPPDEWFDAYGPVDALPEHLRRPGEAFSADLERHLFDITLGEREVGPEELARIRGLYDGSITSTDARIARLLAALEALGAAQDTYVVLSSDHGEELYDRNRYFFHGCSIHDGTVRVPLVVRGPDVPAGRRSDAVVENVDVLPTLLELLGLPGDPEIEGRSFAALLRGEDDAHPAPLAFVEWQDLVYAVTDGRHKLIFNPRHVHPRHSPYGYPGVPADLGYAIACVEGYDLLADPGEQHNLLAGFDLAHLAGGAGLPGPFPALYTALQRWLAEPGHQEVMRPQGLGAEDIERLRQMGYIGRGDRSDYVEKEPCRSGP